MAVVPGFDLLRSGACWEGAVLQRQVDRETRGSMSLVDSLQIERAVMLRRRGLRGKGNEVLSCKTASLIFKMPYPSCNSNFDMRAPHEQARHGGNYRSAQSKNCNSKCIACSAIDRDCVKTILKQTSDLSQASKMVLR